MSRGRIIALVLLLLLGAASVSVSACDALDVAGAAGAPVVAYAAYRYQGSVPNFVHPITYDASDLALARGGPAGRIAFPVALHAHWPFPIQTHPSLQVEMAYVPALHNAVVHLGRFTDSQPGWFQYDHAASRLAMSDLSGNPELWLRTLATVSSTLERLLQEPAQPAARLRDRDPATAALALELIGHFRREYDAFLARHGDVRRPMPAIPLMLSDEEKRRWADAAAADLAKEPTWGAQIRRLYGNGAALTAFESELR